MKFSCEGWVRRWQWLLSGERIGNLSTQPFRFSLYLHELTRISHGKQWYNYEIFLCNGTSMWERREKKKKQFPAGVPKMSISSCVKLPPEAALDSHWSLFEFERQQCVFHPWWREERNCSPCCRRFGWFYVWVRLVISFSTHFPARHIKAIRIYSSFLSVALFAPFLLRVAGNAGRGHKPTLQSLIRANRLRSRPYKFPSINSLDRKWCPSKCTPSLMDIMSLAPPLEVGALPRLSWATTVWLVRKLQSKSWTKSN